MTVHLNACSQIWLAADGWFFPGTPVSSTNKTDHHDITEILLKVALNTITPHPLNYSMHPPVLTIIRGHISMDISTFLCYLNTLVGSVSFMLLFHIVAPKKVMWCEMLEYHPGIWHWICLSHMLFYFTIFRIQKLSLINIKLVFQFLLTFYLTICVVHKFLKAIMGIRWHRISMYLKIKEVCGRPSAEESKRKNLYLDYLFQLR